MWRLQVLASSQVVRQSAVAAPFRSGCAESAEGPVPSAVADGLHETERGWIQFRTETALPEAEEGFSISVEVEADQADASADEPSTSGA